MDKNESTTKPYTHPEVLSPYSSLQIIAKEVGKHKSVLDIGCADGDLARELKNYGTQVWGIDGNSEAVKKARKYCIEAKQVDLNNLPSQKIFNQSFDRLVFADVLEHLLYPDRVLEYFKPYLKSGGKIIVSIPNIGLWRMRINLLFGKFNYTDYGVMDRTHLHFYTFKTAVALLKSAGFKINKIQGAANIFGPFVKMMPFTKNFLCAQIIITASVQ